MERSSLDVAASATAVLEERCSNELGEMRKECQEAIGLQLDLQRQDGSLSFFEWRNVEGFLWNQLNKCSTCFCGIIVVTPARLPQVLAQPPGVDDFPPSGAQPFSGWVQAAAAVPMPQLPLSSRTSTTQSGSRTLRTSRTSQAKSP